MTETYCTYPNLVSLPPYSGILSLTVLICHTGLVVDILVKNKNTNYMFRSNFFIFFHALLPGTSWHTMAFQHTHPTHPHPTSWIFCCNFSTCSLILDSRFFQLNFAAQILPLLFLSLILPPHVLLFKYSLKILPCQPMVTQRPGLFVLAWMFN